MSRRGRYHRRSLPKFETNSCNLILAATKRALVPTGSPSRGGDVTVYVWHKPTELARSFLFCYLIHVSYLLNTSGFFFFFCISCSLCMCIICRIALVPHGRGLDVKKTLSLVHYPCEIKFIHLFIHSFSFCCVCFCLYGSFNNISLRKFSRHFSAFSLYSSDLIFCLASPFNYVSLFQNLP